MTGVPDEQGQRLVVVPGTRRRDAVTSGFQVVLDDLRRVAGAFGTESVTLWGIMPPDGPEGVSGGSPELDGGLARLLEAIGGRHTELAASIAGHGTATSPRSPASPRR